MVSLSEVSPVLVSILINFFIIRGISPAVLVSVYPGPTETCVSKTIEREESILRDLI